MKPHYEGEPPYTEWQYDRAIRFGQFALAGSIINDLIEQKTTHFGLETLNDRAPQLLMKELAIPMHMRAYAETHNQQYLQMEEDISAIYGESVALLRYFHDWAETRHRFYPTFVDGVLRGARSELGIFSLVARTARGGSKDPYTIWSASKRDDEGSGPDRQTGKRNGFDFHVHDRKTDATIRLQVKTSKPLVTYTDDILVVVYNTIAGKERNARDLLEEAMIAEVDGRPSKEQLQRIEAATTRLRNRFNEYTRKNAQPSLENRQKTEQAT